MASSLQREHGVWCLLLPSLAYLALYSALPHKELRFIFPALPALNAVAARGLAKLYVGWRGSPRWLSHARVGLVVSVLLASVAITTVFTAASMNNYPGGEALARMHDWHDAHYPPNHDSATATVGQQEEEEEVWVHVDVAAAMTGVSRFGQREHNFLVDGGGGVGGRRGGSSSTSNETTWRYSKRESITTTELCEYTYVVTADPTALVGGACVDDFEVVVEARGFVRVDFTRLMVETKPEIFVLHNANWRRREEVVEYSSSSS